MDVDKLIKNFHSRRRKHWSIEEIELLKKYLIEGKSTKIISRLLKRSKGSIWQKSYQLNIFNMKTTLKTVAYGYCIWCKKQIPKNAHLSNYKKAKYCSRECADKGHFKVSESKKCKHCSQEFLKRETESIPRFQARQYCSRKCASLSRIDKNKKQIILNNDIVYKKCSKCRQWYPLENFLYLIGRKRYSAMCRLCSNEVKQKSIAKRQAYYDQYKLIYFKNNKEKIKLKHAIYRKKKGQEINRKARLKRHIDNIEIDQIANFIIEELS